MNSRTRATARLIALALLLTSVEAAACPNCATSQEVWSSIQAHRPGSTLGILTFAFATVAVLVMATAAWMRQHRKFFAGSLLLGAGLGALFDGIVFHQVLQWHAMLSHQLDPGDLIASKVNMFWDGVFHVYSWFTVVVGLILVLGDAGTLPRVVRLKAACGGVLAGWGFFNVVEGLIDHHMFELHHVHPGFHELSWDLGFLALGVALLVAGFSVATLPLRHSRTLPDV